jgi:hypothetical protein
MGLDWGREVSIDDVLCETEKSNSTLGVICERWNQVPSPSWWTPPGSIVTAAEESGECTAVLEVGDGCSVGEYGEDGVLWERGMELMEPQLYCRIRTVSHGSGRIEGFRRTAYMAFPHQMIGPSCRLRILHFHSWVLGEEKGEGEWVGLRAYWRWGVVLLLLWLTMTVLRWTVWCVRCVGCLGLRGVDEAEVLHEVMEAMIDCIPRALPAVWLFACSGELSEGDGGELQQLNEGLCLSVAVITLGGFCVHREKTFTDGHP